MRKRIALVDADGILYAAALRGETSCDGEQLQLLDISHVYRDCIQRIEEQVGWTDADDAFIILSDRRNFRHDILPSYKAHRGGKKQPRPLLLDQLRGMIVEKAPYQVMLIAGLEADDVCGIAAGGLQASGSETVVVSPDKDLLQIPGLFLQVPGTNSKTRGKRTIIEISEEDGDWFHMRQTLSGDQVDNYSGCPGFGPAKADKFVEGCREVGYSIGQAWVDIVQKYEAKDLTEEDALVQARVARILRSSDWDTKRKEPILWTPPSAVPVQMAA